MKIGDLVYVLLDHKHPVVGEIISLEPEIRLRNLYGREAPLFSTRDTIRLLTDGEAMLYKLENA